MADGDNVKQIRIDNGQLIRRIFVQSTPNSICISPDDEFLYVSYNTMNLTVRGSPIHKYRVADGSLMSMNGCKGNRICISHDGVLLFISRDYSNEIQVVETADGSNVRTIQLDRDRPAAPYDNGNICLSPDGNILFVVDNFYNQIHIVRVKGEYRILQIPFFRASCISMDGEFLFTAESNNNHIEVLRIEDGSTVRSIKCGDIGIDSICISPDEKEIFTRGFRENRIRVFQL
jgi:sugar lactone lactonase YvrE